VCPRNSKVNNRNRVLIFACCKAHMESQVDGYSTWKQRGEYGQAISSNYSAYIRCMHTQHIYRAYIQSMGQTVACYKSRMKSLQKVRQVCKSEQ
jgi:hypothetical protein